MIKYSLSALHFRLRRSRIELFIQLCSPRPSDSILDVGIAGNEYHPYDNMLEKIYAGSHNITGLGMGDLSNVSSLYNIPCISYDGNAFPFADNSFDTVFSNAVLEHVGPAEKQALFVEEILRVSRKYAFLSTPNKWFPVDLHTRIPFVHYLSKKYSDPLYVLFGKRWATGDYMNLISRSEIMELLEKMVLRFKFEFKVIPNRFCSLTAAHIIYIRKV